MRTRGWQKSVVRDASSRNELVAEFVAEFVSSAERDASREHAVARPLDSIPASSSSIPATRSSAASTALVFSELAVATDDRRDSVSVESSCAAPHGVSPANAALSCASPSTASPHLSAAHGSLSSSSSSSSPSSSSLERLRAEMEKLERRRGGGEAEWVSTGCRGLDRLLSVAGGRAGVARGSLTEWFSGGAGSGAATMAWSVACAAARRGGYVVVLDRQRRFYPPAAVAWGVAAERLAVVRVEREEDELWVVDQTLRSPAVAAVWVWRDELSGRDFRRWQLAAEVGGAVGVVLRPARARGQPTWADVQLQVEPAGRGKDAGGERERAREQGAVRERGWRLSVELVRCRGGVAGTRVVVEWDGRCGEWREVGGEDGSDSVPAIARLAHSATASRGVGGRAWNEGVG